MTVLSRGDSPALLQEEHFLQASSEEETVTSILPFHILFLLMTSFSSHVPKFTLREKTNEFIHTIV